jgi:GT2 family glycosyltransferase
MPSPIQLTVSIVTFRTDRATLTATLDSLKASRIPLSVLLVDNTPEESYFATLPTSETMRAVRSPRNGGYGFGHNIALTETAASHAPYHLILNPDVVVHPECLEQLIAQMESDPAIALAMPKILNPDGSIQRLNKRHPTVLDLALRRFVPRALQKLPFIAARMDYFERMDIGYEVPSEIPYASGCFMLFRRATLNELSGFDERFFMYFEDADLSRRAATLGRVQYFPNAVITHHWTRGSHTNWKLMLCTLTSAYRYFNKWGWKLW